MRRLRLQKSKVSIFLSVRYVLRVNFIYLLFLPISSFDYLVLLSHLHEILPFLLFQLMVRTGEIEKHKRKYDIRSLPKERTIASETSVPDARILRRSAKEQTTQKDVRNAVISCYFSFVIMIS